MMQNQTSTAGSQLAASGILLILLYLVWQLMVVPYYDVWQEKISDIEFLKQNQSRLRFLIDDSDQIKARAQQLNQSESLNDLFLSEKTGALSDAKFQRIVRQIVSENNGRVIQIVVAKAATESVEKVLIESTKLDSITARVVMQGNIQAIYAALHKLENSSPMIILSNLDISHNQSRYQISRTTGDTVYTVSYDATAFIL